MKILMQISLILFEFSGFFQRFFEILKDFFEDSLKCSHFSRFYEDYFRNFFDILWIFRILSKIL